MIDDSAEYLLLTLGVSGERPTTVREFERSVVASDYAQATNAASLRPSATCFATACASDTVASVGLAA